MTSYGLKTKLNKIDKEKLHLLEQVNFDSPVTFSLYINLINIVIKFNFHGEGSDEKYLRDYYKHFLTDLKDHDCEVDLYFFSDDKRALGHYLWSERMPKVLYLERDDDTDYLLQRDFISTVSKDGSHYKLLGPDINSSNPDSLDNLVSFVFSTFSKKSKALIVHAAGVVKDDLVHVFFGQSGAGKSTLAEMCVKQQGLKVIASDQLYLRIIDGELHAQATSITIPELDRNSEFIHWEPLKVGSMIHLTQNGEYGLFKKSSISLVKDFINQTLIYLGPQGNQQDYINLVGELFSLAKIRYGRLKYKKDNSFWSLFDGY